MRVSLNNAILHLTGERSDFGLASAHSVADTVLAPKVITRRPPLYKVLLLNDDYTPMEFVVHILQKYFEKEYDEAMRIMLQVHHQGAGVAGTFSFEIAETKVVQVNQYSKSQKHPLKATMEKA